LITINYYGSPNHHVAVRSSDASTETTIGTDIVSTQDYLRITRVGNAFSFYHKALVGDAWTLHGTTTRSDLGATIRVGLMAATNNTNNNYQATFDGITFS
jgi:hypothetical protein